LAPSFAFFLFFSECSFLFCGETTAAKESQMQAKFAAETAIADSERTKKLALAAFNGEVNAAWVRFFFVFFFLRGWENGRGRGDETDERGLGDAGKGEFGGRAAEPD
jgi:hypothetical protein